jgi:hypothetical protein
MGTKGLVHNRFRLVAINRGKTDARVTFSLADLPAAKILGVEDGVTLKPEETLQREFDIAAAASAVGAGVNHFRILIGVAPAQTAGEFQETFIAPMESTPAPARK